MKKLDINITQAMLKSYTVELKEGKPEVSATIELLTAGGISVTTYTVSTDSWQDKNKFELPIAAIMPIVELAKVLESVTVDKCRDSQLALGSGLTETDPITADSFVVEAEIADSDDYANPKTRDKDIIIVQDKPIDLSEIPF